MNFKKYFKQILKNKYYIILLISIMAFINFTSSIIKFHLISIEDFEERIIWNTINLLVLIFSFIISSGILYEFYKKIFETKIELSFIKAIKKYISQLFSAGIFIGILYLISLILYYFFKITLAPHNVYLRRLIYEFESVVYIYITAFVLPIIFLKDIDGYDAIWFSIEYVIKTIKHMSLTLVIIIIIQKGTIFILEISKNFLTNYYIMWILIFFESFIDWFFFLFIFGYTILLLKQNETKVEMIINNNYYT